LKYEPGQQNNQNRLKDVNGALHDTHSEAQYASVRELLQNGGLRAVIEVNLR
jgi:hypothetical protein